MTAESKGLIRDFAARNIYKRLFEVSFASLSAEALKHLKGRLDWGSRNETLRTINTALKRLARKVLESKEASFLSLNADPSEAISVLEAGQNDVLVPELPQRELGPGGTPPPVQKDIVRKRGIYTSREDATDSLGHIWKNGMTTMMAEISMCRIFCQPAYYEVIVATLNQAVINTVMSYVLWDETLPTPFPKEVFEPEKPKMKVP